MLRLTSVERKHGGKVDENEEKKKKKPQER